MPISSLFLDATLLLVCLRPGPGGVRGEGERGGLGGFQEESKGGFVEMFSHTSSSLTFPWLSTPFHYNHTSIFFGKTIPQARQYKKPDRIKMCRFVLLSLSKCVREKVAKDNMDGTVVLWFIICAASATAAHRSSSEYTRYGQLERRHRFPVSASVGTAGKPHPGKCCLEWCFTIFVTNNNYETFEAEFCSLNLCECSDDLFVPL